jgi:hypothetical protein
MIRTVDSVLSVVLLIIWRILVQIIRHKIVPGVIPLIPGKRPELHYFLGMYHPHTFFTPDPQSVRQIMSTEVRQII